MEEAILSMFWEISANATVEFVKVGWSDQLRDF